MRTCRRNCHKTFPPPRSSRSERKAHRVAGSNETERVLQTSRLECLPKLLEDWHDAKNWAVTVT